MQGGSNMAAGVREGDVLAGKYRVERVLGAGGMGVVVAAHHIHLDEKVALKFLLPGALGDSEAVARFAREARNAVKIKSEHVARVFDVGTLETGAPYMVMEYLNGVDLAGWLRQRGPLSFEETIDFVLQAGEAIAEAHSLGIVHRDLKPANLFCIRSADRRPTIKVLDFGISKMTGASASASNMSLTKTAALMGSPFYMSPEQMEGTRAVDSLTDIWALGVILHELLTGKVPFHGDTVTEVAVKVGTRAPPPLRDFRPDAPEGLQAVIFRCLEKDRQRRYPDVSALALALLPFGSRRARSSVEKITAIIEGAGLSASALSVPPPPEPTSQPPSSETMAPLGRTATGGKGGKARVGMFVAVGVMALAGGVAAIRHSSRGSRVAGSADTGASAIPLPGAASLEPADLPAPRGAERPGRASEGAPTPSGLATVLDAGLAPSMHTSGPTTAAAISSHPIPGPPSPLPAKGAPSRPATFAVPAATPATKLAAPPPSPRPDCDPPYTLDDQGQKHFKPECYR